MTRKISLVEKRKWLELYESGKSEASIAEDAHRDARTVKKGIEDARREKEATQVKMELLKEAVRKHQDALLKVMEELLSAVKVPPEISRAVPWNWQGDPIPITTGVTGYDISVDKDSNSANVVLYAERRPEWNLLKEHLKSEPIWKVLADWEKSISVFVVEKALFQKNIVTFLQKKTGYKVVTGYVKPAIFARTAAGMIFETVLLRALGMSDHTNPESMIVADTSTGKVMYGTDTILADVPGDEEKCTDIIIDAFKKLKKSKEILQIKGAYKDLKESTTKTRKTIEEISLLGLIPGKCHVCRRLGM